MKLIKNPEQSTWINLCERPKIAQKKLSETVAEVFNNVKTKGDKAVLTYTEQFDKAKLASSAVLTSEIAESSATISDDLKGAINLAKVNIETFHSIQKEKVSKVETMRGVTCWRETRAIDRVGIYIPGGTAPLFSTVLMLGIPAKLAGCKEIVLCTPPNKNGKVNPAILYAASLVGVTSVYKVGGIQAIAALTFGTESIPKVNKLFGPGNQYVTAAKQFAQNYGVAIDMPAGPSEVLIIADKAANPEFVAADLLSQAEHGADSQVILLSDNEAVLNACITEVEKQCLALPRQSIAEAALKNSKAVLLNSLDDCIIMSNVYAPEHLILAVKNADTYTSKIVNAGSVFLGNYSCESAGDYASGTNHTLPTNGYAKNYSGVSLDSFVKKITFQNITEEGIKNIGPAIELMAEAEDLIAHKNAVSVRLKALI